MSDPVIYALLFAAALIVAIVAILLFTKAPQRRPAPPGMGSALLALADNDRKGARRILTAAVREAETSPEAFLVLGRLLREAGDAERAVGLHRALLARPRLSASDRLASEIELVRDLLAIGRSADALARVVDLRTHFHDMRLVDLHARALVADGRMESAAEVWREGARAFAKEGLGARGAGFLAEVAREYLRLGQPETAERWAKQALKLDEKSSLAHVVLGDVARGQGHDREVRKHYAEALATGGTRWVLPRLLDHAHQHGQVDRLIDVLEPAREERPDDAALARAVLDLRIRRGERDEFFALLESGDLPRFTDPLVWTPWVRQVAAKGSARDLERLLAALPVALGPELWRCNQCGVEDHEPRAACLSCGSSEPLRPARSGERS